MVDVEPRSPSLSEMPAAAAMLRRSVLGLCSGSLVGLSLGMLGPLAGCAAPSMPRTAAPTASRPDDPDAELTGQFEVVAGRPGIVVGVPHGTADTATMDIGRVLCERLGAGGVFVTGFWDGKLRRRVNVNRPNEQQMGEGSQVLRQWPSERAVAANARYEALVRQVAQGPLRAFYEMHSNSWPQYAASIEVSTLGVSRADATRFKAAFEAARDRLPQDVPRLAIHVSPVDVVTYPVYGNASSVSKFSASGCAIEHPGRTMASRAWRLAYAACLAEAIAAVPWG